MIFIQCVKSSVTRVVIFLGVFTPKNRNKEQQGKVIFMVVSNGSRSMQMLPYTIPIAGDIKSGCWWFRLDGVFPVFPSISCAAAILV